ncbi:MAG: RAMP superfamily CRISPR-associated protein [Anaerolineae bacterium]|nr:RAMP superfamily CRISPR-associated protein [Anaerolineae bacterium]
MTRRYRFEGTLTSVTGLHVGSGQGDFSTDARFVRTGDGRPYIPGSSFKGALRSAVERMAASLQGVGPGGMPLRTCLLDGSSGLGDPNCPTVHQGWQTAFSQAREKGLSELDIERWLYQGVAPFQDVTLCDTCRLFGSPYVASKVAVQDLYLQAPTHTEVRHGVGIDRDTGTARAQIKFDYETVPAQVAFEFRLLAESLTRRELGLLCCGLRQWEQGDVTLGGNSSRGLGGCELTLTHITEMELGSATAWLDRLLETRPEAARGTTVHDGAAAVTTFMNSAIQALFQELGVT